MSQQHGARRVDGAQKMLLILAWAAVVWTLAWHDDVAASLRNPLFVF